MNQPNSKAYKSCRKYTLSIKHSILAVRRVTLSNKFFRNHSQHVAPRVNTFPFMYRPAKVTTLPGGKHKQNPRVVGTILIAIADNATTWWPTPSPWSNRPFHAEIIVALLPFNMNIIFIYYTKYSVSIISTMYPCIKTRFC